MIKREPEYVSRKLREAIECMCADGEYISRLKNATLSALIRLGDDDLGGEHGDELAFVFSWTTKNMRDGKFLKIPNHDEQNMIIEKMLTIMIATCGE